MAAFVVGMLVQALSLHSRLLINSANRPLLRSSVLIMYFNPQQHSRSGRNTKSKGGCGRPPVMITDISGIYKFRLNPIRNIID